MSDVDKTSPPMKSNRLTRSILPLVVAFISAAPVVFGQVVGEKVGPQFPFLTSSARSSAMADASGALIDDYSGFGSNPGVLGLIQNSMINFSTQRIQSGISFEHVGVAYRTTSLDAIALSLDVLHFGGTDFYTDTKIRKLGFELRTGLAYGRRISETFSVGLNVQVLMATTGPTSVWGAIGDIGLAYAPEKYIRYAFFLKGLGSNYDVVAPVLQADVFNTRISKVMGLAVAIDYPFDQRSKRVVVAMQNEKILGEPTLIYRMGLEYFPYWSTTDFRFGIRGGLVARDPDVEPRFGLATGYSSISVDYGYRYSRRFNQPSHMFTLTYAW